MPVEFSGGKGALFVSNKYGVLSCRKRIEAARSSMIGPSFLLADCPRPTVWEARTPSPIERPVQRGSEGALRPSLQKPQHTHANAEPTRVEPLGYVEPEGVVEQTIDR